MWFYAQKNTIWELVRYNFQHYTLICVSILFVITCLILWVKLNNARMEIKFKELETKWEKEEYKKEKK